MKKEKHDKRETRKERNTEREKTLILNHPVS